MNKINHITNRDNDLLIINRLSKELDYDEIKLIKDIVVKLNDKRMLLSIYREA